MGFGLLEADICSKVDEFFSGDVSAKGGRDLGR